MKHIMVDLETYGTRAGCGILSIGAVFFDWNKPAWQGPTFYTAVNRESCKAAGLVEQADTLKWWEDQGSKARVVWQEIETAPPLAAALSLFNDWAHANKKDSISGLWGNGADFDNPILSAAHHATGVKQPWGPFQGRCYRTLKALRPDVKLVRQGTHHNALDDALSQAEHAVRLLKALGVKS
jgi:DNA polymerase III epsilon subunit-like protein